jgi:glycosyltransferase involved in cell wall biosynthesis
MVKEKEISLIIPTYNSEKTILQTISAARGFLNQFNYEIIIVDDGSTDNTVGTIEDMKNSIQVFALPHHGVSHTRNVGIHKATGKYVMFCDADDCLLGRLPKIEYKEDIINFSKSSKVNNRLYISKKDKYDLISSMFGFNLGNEDFPAFYGGSVSKLFNRSFLIANKIFFDERLANSEDILFNTKAILLADSIRVIRQGIYCYQGRITSVTHSFDRKLLKNHIYFMGV